MMHDEFDRLNILVVCLFISISLILAITVHIMFVRQQLYIGEKPSYSWPFTQCSQLMICHCTWVNVYDSVLYFELMEHVLALAKKGKHWNFVIQLFDFENHDLGRAVIPIFK